MYANVYSSNNITNGILTFLIQVYDNQHQTTYYIKGRMLNLELGWITFDPYTNRAKKG